MKTYYVTDLNKGEEITDFFIAKRAEVKTGANGKRYFDILLGDKTGEVSGKKWDVDGPEEQTLSRYNAGDIVKVKAMVNEWEGSPQLRVSKIRPLTDSDVIDQTDYVRAAPESSQEMYDYLAEKAGSIKDEDFKTISITLLERNKEKLIYYPAAKMNHHAVYGGLLFHTKRMLMMAELLCEVYTSLSRDLLVAGVIIHDIEKINEMNADTSGVVSEYTFEGQMLGHLVMGVRTIDRLRDEFGFSEEKAVLLEHMMISHHYEPEFGSPRRPLFPEAEALHYLDMIDSKLYDFDDNLANVTPGRFSEWVRTLDGRRLYKATTEIKKYE
jgi:3'-5' exoribonuclease